MRPPQEVPWYGWHNWITSIVFSTGEEGLEADSWMYLWGWEWLQPEGWERVTRTLETQTLCLCLQEVHSSNVSEYLPTHSQPFPEYREFTSPSILPSLFTQDHPWPFTQGSLLHRITFYPNQQNSKPNLKKKKNKPQTRNETQKHSSVQKAFLKQKLTKHWALFCCLRHVNALFIHFKLFPATELPKHFVSVGWAAPCLPWQRAHTVIWLALLSRIRW